MGDLVTLLLSIIFSFGLGGAGLKMFVFSLIRVCLSVCLSVCLPACLPARGNSGTDESVFMSFRPNIGQFKHPIKNLMTTTTTDPVHDNLHMFRLASPAIAPKRFDHRLQPH